MSLLIINFMQNRKALRCFSMCVFFQKLGEYILYNCLVVLSLLSLFHNAGKFTIYSRFTLSIPSISFNRLIKSDSMVLFFTLNIIFPSNMFSLLLKLMESDRKSVV